MFGFLVFKKKIDDKKKEKIKTQQKQMSYEKIKTRFKTVKKPLSLSPSSGVILGASQI